MVFRGCRGSRGRGAKGCFMQALDFMQWDCNIKRRASGVPLNKISDAVEEKSTRRAGKWDEKRPPDAFRFPYTWLCCTIDTRGEGRHATARDLAGALKCASYSPPIVVVIYYALDRSSSLPLFLCLLKRGLDITVARLFNPFSEREERERVSESSFVREKSLNFSRVRLHTADTSRTFWRIDLNRSGSGHDIRDRFSYMRLVSFRGIRVLSICHEYYFVASYNYFRVSRFKSAICATNEMSSNYNVSCALSA